MFRFFKKTKKPAWPPLLPRVRHSIRTLALSADDDISRPDSATLDLALKAAAQAATISLAGLAQKFAAKPDAIFYDVFPGEHYRMLAALARVLAPQLVVEIGTFTGMSTRVLADYSPAGTRIMTFDIAPWTQFNTHLAASDFGVKCEQVLSDLRDEANFDAHRARLANADFIFLDGPKDVDFEWTFLRRLASLHFARDAWLMIDDIRMWNMLGIWRRIASPKLDLTSFGHWSGTGLVHVGHRLALE